MQPLRLFRRISSGALSNVGMRDFQRLVDAFGFVLVRVSGSHHIYAHPELPELIDLQPHKGEVKPYQIRQFLQLVQKHGLSLTRK